ncbi:MAG TPA: hypothetical protein DDY31_12440 [Lachnospiraceae bacterium]|nr:hypothetical protein [Lachnospiraceae bacterium]
MVLESVVAVVKEAAKEIAEKALKTTEEIMKKEVESLPEQIGESSEVGDWADKIGGRIETDDLPDEIGDDITSKNQENLNDAQDNGNIENIGETDAPEKKGGSYDEVFREGKGDKYEVHHMPADSASNLERGDGPAIKMEKEDHRQTASCGSSREAREYRAQQKELIEQGKFREALQMDIDDIHEKFGDKYDDAISEMLEYVDKLEAEGKING